MRKKTDGLAPAPLLPGSHLQADSAARGRALLETHLDVIHRQLHRLSWRSGLPDPEAEEFRSWALCKLVDDDYRILGRWEGRSSFPTYLTVVLVNLMRDYRTHVWGKWRPCAASRRGGPAGTLLERLVVRDGLASDEALERLRTDHGIHVSPEDAARLVAALPRRSERRWVSEDELLRVPIDGHVESRLEEKEQARTTDRLRQLLLPLLQSLPAEDRLILRLYFFEGFKMAAISRILGRPQRELYSVRDRCLKKMRRSLDAAGLGSTQVCGLIGQLQGSLGLEKSLAEA